MVIAHILVLRKRGITLRARLSSAEAPSKRDSERLPGLQGRKIASFDRTLASSVEPLRMRFCSLRHLWVITR